MDQSRSGPVPEPGRDWITQRSLAAALGVSQRTASLWSGAGKLRRYEHGMPDCGRRKYSRALVERELRRRWEIALDAQDALMGGGEA